MSNTKTIETFHVLNLNDFIEPDMGKNVVNGKMTFKLFYEIFDISLSPSHFDMQTFVCKSLAQRVRKLHKFHLRDNAGKYLANEREIECEAVEKFAMEMQTLGECNPRAMVAITSLCFVETKISDMLLSTKAL